MLENTTYKMRKNKKDVRRILVMFCSTCGSEIPEGASFCEKCGESVENILLGVNSYSQYTESQYDTSNNQQNLSNVFIEPDEHLLGNLGNGYLVNLLFHGTKKCYALLTDKRVYLKGAFYHGRDQRLLFKTTEEQILDLEDITRTGFVYTQFSRIQLFIRIMLGVAAIVLARNFVWDREFFLIFGILVIIVTFLSVLRCIKSRRIWFYIDCAGGSIKIDAKLIGLSDVQDFHKQMRRAKDAITGKK